MFVRDYTSDVKSKFKQLLLGLKRIRLGSPPRVIIYMHARPHSPLPRNEESSKACIQIKGAPAISLSLFLSLSSPRPMSPKRRRRLVEGRMQPPRISSQPRGLSRQFKQSVQVRALLLSGARSFGGPTKHRNGKSHNRETEERRDMASLSQPSAIHLVREGSIRKRNPPNKKTCSVAAQIRLSSRIS